MSEPHLPPAAPGGLREFSYLTAQKSGVYRAVMSFIARESRFQRHAFPPEELGHLMNLADSDAPSVILDALVAWGNLSRRRDLRRASTLAEYARRRELYSATPRGLAIEAFIETGLDASAVTAPVGADVLSRIETLLGELNSDLRSGVPDPEACEGRWKRMIEAFQAMSGDLRSLALNLDRKLSLGATDDFLIFKGAASSYITRFETELRGPGQRVGQLLASLQSEVQPLLDALITHRTGSLTRDLGVIDAAQARREVQAEWQAISGWFSRDAQTGDGLNLTILQLNQAASQVLSYVEAVHRSRNLGSGRAADLRALAEKLDALDDPGRARETLNQALQLFSPLHHVGHPGAESWPDSWTAPGEPVTLTPSVRGRRTNAEQQAIGTVSPEARALARKASAERDRYDAALEALFAQKVTLHGLRLPDRQTLQDILGWVSQARARQGGAVHGPGGRLLQVTFTPGSSCIHSEAGDWHLWVDVQATLTLASASAQPVTAQPVTAQPITAQPIPAQPIPAQPESALEVS